MKLAEKIAAASKSVGGKLKADKTNTQDRYDYVSADAILTFCGQALAENGVIVLPEIESDTIEMGQSSRGTPRHDAFVDMVFTITDGEETIHAKWIGRGSDYTVPDKALYKAVTSGHKYFLAKLLNVGAGNEDGEHEDGEVQKERKSNGKKTPEKIAAELGFDKPEPKSSRPLDPESLRDAMARKAEKKTGQASDVQRQVIAKQLNTILGGDTQRKELMDWLLDTRSTKELTDGQVFATLDWLGVAGYDDPPNQYAITEARTAHTYALQAQGQQDLFNV